jgi:hypothetical protein
LFEEPILGIRTEGVFELYLFVTIRNKIWAESELKTLKGLDMNNH